MGRFSYLNEDIAGAEDLQAEETEAASFTDPVVRTREIKAGRPFEIPGSMVSDVSDLERKQQLRSQQLLLLQRDHPELSSHFRDPERAAGGWDDVGSISDVIDSVLDATGISRVGQAYTSGKANVDMVSIVTSVMASDKAGVAIDPDVFAQLEELRQQQAAFDPGDLGLEDVIPLVAQQIPNFQLMAKYGLAGAAVAGAASSVTGFSTLPAAIPFGGVAGATLAMSTVEFTAAYMEYRDIQDEAGNKLDPDIAIGMAASYGILAGAVEVGGTALLAKFAARLGVATLGTVAGEKAIGSLASKALMRKALANSIKGALQGKTKRDLFKTIGKGVAAAVVSQGIEEGTQEWLNVAGGVAAREIQQSRTGAFEEFDVSEGLFGVETRERIGGAAAAGALVGVGIAGAGATVGGTAGLAARRLSGNAQAAETFGEKLEGMEEVRKKSRLAREDPVAFAEAVATETGNLEPVAVDAAGLVKFYQGDLAAIEAAVPSLTQEAISTAADAGMDVQVPFSEYVAYVSGSQLSEGFKANARVDGRALTLSQIDTLNEDLDQQLKLAKDSEGEDFSGAYEAFVSDAFDQLTGAGVSERVARMTAKIWGAAQFNLAERAGMDPLEEYAGAQITGPTEQQRTLSQPTVAERLRAGSTPLFPSRPDTGRSAEEIKDFKEKVIAEGFPQEAMFAGERVTVLGVVGATGRRDEPLSEPTLESLDAKGGQVRVRATDGRTFTTFVGGLRSPTDSRILEQPAIGIDIEGSTIEGTTTDTPAFRAWFDESKVVDEDGEPEIFLHATTHDVEAFDTVRGQVENDFGNAFYFTNSSEDASANYAGVGPDLTNRVEQRSDRLESELDIEREEALRLAMEELVGPGASVIPVYLSIQNPVQLGGESPTWFEIVTELDEEGEVVSEEGSLLELADALRVVASDEEFFDVDVEVAIGSLLEAADFDSLTAELAVTVLKESEGLQFAIDDTGNLVASEIIRRAFEEMGFDGIIDRTVNEKFGEARESGKAMAGVDADTTHVIAFKPTQIKSKFNSGSFDPTDPRILKQPAFHGTAAKFDKFTLDHIGTGEGAQAFGWGLYFAELRDVAELYREQLIRQKDRGKYSIDGTEIPTPDRGGDFTSLDAAIDGELEARIDLIGRRITRLESDHADFSSGKELSKAIRADRIIQRENKNLDFAKSLLGKTVSVEREKGQILKVDLPEDSELLDYDKPLSEQPEGVREKLEGISGNLSASSAREKLELIVGSDFASSFSDTFEIRQAKRILEEGDPEEMAEWAAKNSVPGKSFFNMFGDGDNGAAMYANLSRQLGSDQAASQALLAAGIPGLKYFDGFSRTKERGTSNYVIWDENAISILQTFFQPDGRAEVAIADSGQLLINLKAASDPSTALHEFSHGFLDKMVRLGANLDAGHQINQDLQSVREWMKGESKSILNWLKNNQEKLPEGAFDEIVDRGGASFIEERALSADLDLNSSMDVAELGATIGLHEQFARGAELYMYEGKAPSAQLREAFVAFVDWMVEIYKDVRSALGVELNDEVRGVFDRLLASDAQIEAAHQNRSDELQNIESALELSPKAAKELQDAREQQAREAKQTVRQRALKDERKKRRQLESSLRPAIEREVEQEISKRRDYLAFDYVKSQKLNRPAVVSLVTKELASAASRLTSPKGKTAPEELQGRYGYDSVPEMLEILAGLPPIKQAVKEETDRRLLERLGPPEVEQPVESVVESAAGREKVLRAELAAIAAQPAVARAARHRVAETGAVTPVEQKAAREAAQETLDAATTPEEIEAATLEVARLQAERAPSEQERRSASTRRSQEATVRKQARAQADELRAVAESRVARLRSADVRPEAFLRAQDHARREVDRALRDRDYPRALEHQRRRIMHHYAHKAAVKAAKKIKAAKKRATRLQKASTQRAIGAAMPSAIEQINSLISRAGLLSSRLGAFADITHPPMIKWMDEREQAGDDIGSISPFMIGFVPEFDDMQIHQVEAFDQTLQAIHEISKLSSTVTIGEETHRLKDVIDTLVASIEANDISRKKVPSKDRNVIGFVPTKKKLLRMFDASLLKIERIIDWLDGGEIDGPMRKFVFTQISAAQSAEADMQKDIPHRIIAAFEGMSQKRLNTRIHIPEVDQTFRVSDIMAVALNLGTESSYDKVKRGENWDDTQIDAIIKHLNDDEWSAVEGVWKTLEDLGTLLFDTHQQLTGIRPSKLEVRSYTTPGGREVTGGYYPAVYDPTKGDQGARNYESKNSEIMENNYTTRGVDTTSGATIGRTGFAAQFWFDLSILPSHVSEVIHDVTHRKALNDAWRVVSSKPVQNAIDESLGVEYRELFKPWLQSIANDRTTINKDLRAWSRLFSALRTNTAIMAMGFKATTFFSQFAGFSNAMGRAFEADYRGELLNQMRLAVAHPIAMRNYAFEKSGEMRNRAKNLDRDLRDVGRKIAGKSGVLKQSQQFAMHGMAMADLVVTVPVWHAGYNAALKKGLSEKDAIQFGDREVRLSQGAGGAKDLADVQRGSEFWKLMTNFYSYLSALYSQLRDTGHQVKSIGDVPQAMAKYFFYVIMSSLLAEALSNRWPDEDDEMTLLEMALWKSATTPLSTIPVVRDIINTIESGRSYKLSPIQGAGESAIRVALDVMSLFDEDSEVALDQFGKDALQLSGYALGLPINQLQITYTNVRSVIEDGADFNMWDVLFYQKEK